MKRYMTIMTNPPREYGIEYIEPVKTNKQDHATEIVKEYIAHDQRTDIRQEDTNILW